MSGEADFVRADQGQEEPLILFATFPTSWPMGGRRQKRATCHLRRQSCHSSSPYKVIIV